MSFTLTIKATKVSSYPNLGLVDPTSGTEEDVEVTYNVNQIDNILNGIVTIVYSAQIGDSSPVYDFFKFSYDSGDIFSLAEEALEKQLRVE